MPPITLPATSFRSSRREPAARKQRKPQRPAVDFSAVYDPPLLADGYKSRVAAALPPGAVASDVFWNALTAAVAFYVMQQQRRLRRPHLQARERWEGIVKLIDALARELRIVRRETRLSHSDPMWPNRALDALAVARRKADAHADYHRTLATAFKGRRNPDRWAFYAAVFDLWTGPLAQDGLRFSIGPNGQPHGPLIGSFKPPSRRCWEPTRRRRTPSPVSSGEKGHPPIVF